MLFLIYGNVNGPHLPVDLLFHVFTSLIMQSRIKGLLERYKSIQNQDDCSTMQPGRQQCYSFVPIISSDPKRSCFFLNCYWRHTCRTKGLHVAQRLLALGWLPKFHLVQMTAFHLVQLLLCTSTSHDINYLMWSPNKSLSLV